MDKIIGNQFHIDLRRCLDICPNCGELLMMMGCDNPRCVNYHGNKRFFYHETIKTQEEIDDYFKDKDNKLTY